MLYNQTAYTKAMARFAKRTKSKKRNISRTTPLETNPRADLDPASNFASRHDRINTIIKCCYAPEIKYHLKETEQYYNKPC